MTEINQKKATVYALLTVLMWSTVASAFKIALRTLNVIELLLIANITSVLVLAVIAFFSGRWKNFTTLKSTDLIQSALFGFLNPFLYYLILFKAYDLLPAQQALAINYTWAILLPLFAVPILKQKLHKQDLFGLVIAYIGVLIISTSGNLSGIAQTNTIGIICALLSTVIWALYWACNTKRTIDPVIGLLLNFCFGLVFTAGYYLLFTEHLVISHKGLLAAIYIGIFEMSLTFCLWLTALRLSNNTAKISSLIFLSPFISFVYIYFLLGEEIKITSIIGLIIILGGLALQKRAHSEI